MVDLEDPSSVNALLKKLCCHGQAIAPIQGLAYAAWALTDHDASPIFKGILYIAAIKFPFWGYISWQALNKRYGVINSYLYLIRFGIVIVMVDVLILIMAVMSGELGNGAWTLLAFVSTCLHVIETLAFGSAVYCFRWVLQRGGEEDEEGESRYITVHASSYN